MGWSRSIGRRRELRAARVRLTWVLLWLVHPVLLAAQRPAAPQPVVAAARPLATAPHRLRIGLVLSGGGARGIAHVGVLKVLETLHVPIDAIAGTSMGAVVGGLYASGLSPDQIEASVRSMNWEEAFRDRPPREDLTLRRKQEDENFLVKFPIGIKGGRPVLPMGLIEGQSLTEMLRRLTLPVARITNFDDLPTPFRAVATDLESGREVVMGSGDLTSAMRASLSAPGVFAPVERGGRLLVDGGISDNVPVDVARAMGVDIVIVVDVGFPLLPRKRLTSVTAISNQMLAILVRRKSQQELALLGPHDILIRPDLGDISSFDFGNVHDLLGVGAAAAWQMRSRLAKLAVTPEQYARYEQRREALRRPPPRIDFVKVQTGSKAYSQPVGKLFKDMVGKKLDPDAVGRRITTIYGEGGLDTLDYRVVRQDDEYGLLVDARGNSIGPNYVRFGLSLQDDFEGDSTYDAAIRYVMSEITRTGGEWVSDAQIGQTSLLSTEVFLPLSQFSGWFVMPHAAVEARNLPFLIGQTERAQYRVDTFDYGLDFGKQFGNWGEIRTGVYREEGHSRLTIGDPDDPELPFPAFQIFGSRTYFARFTYDTLDDINFPHFGEQAMLQWSGERNVVGGEPNSNQVTLDFLAAHTWRDRDTLSLSMSGGSDLDRVTDLRLEFPLGGFLNLSGLKQYSLYGPHYGIGRLMFYRKIGRGGLGYFDVPVYIGMSLEVGNVWQNTSDAKFTNLHKDASVFLGLDTFLGPVYLGTGFDDHGDQAFYLFLGRTF
ncbi:MAG: patatin-like phospholipase family protein [Steroidobacteraceae bacterium]